MNTIKHACEIVWLVFFVLLMGYLLKCELKFRPKGQRKRYVGIVVVSATWPLWVGLVGWIVSKAKPAKIIPPSATPDAGRRQRDCRR